MNRFFRKKKSTLVILLAGLMLWPALSYAQWSGTGAPTNSSTGVSSTDFPAGTLTIATDETLQFPLKHTDVKAAVSGSVAEVEVRQEYINPFTTPIEAVYVFPLPNNAAVYDMEMHVGNRVIRSEIKRREEAKQIYEQAKDEGKRAALLEQERPNIFTQSVANILPGDAITILIRYEEALVFDRNTYQFVFPMVVGPRYIPGDWLEENYVSGVTDWQRITPPILPEGMRSGHDIAISVTLETGGIPITAVNSVTHQVDITQPTSDTATINIKAGDTIPNKDFVLNYELGSTKPQFAFFPHQPVAGDGYFSLMVQPQTDFTNADITPKEIFFIVDTSGSMSGEPIAKAQQAMEYALKHLNPEDTFYLMSFSNVTERLSEKPLPNTPDNILRGLQYIRDIVAGGGTEMLPGILEALSYPHDPRKLRIVTMMGDGYIGNEDEILSAMQEKLGDQTRLFSFGVGSSTNRYLLDNMGRIGRGGAYYVTLRDDAKKIIDEFYRRIASPLFTDLAIDWGTLEVSELYPSLVPDIFAGQPLFVYGRYHGSGSTTIKVTGRVARVEEGSGSALKKLFGGSADVSRTTELFSIPVTIPTNDERDWVGRLWARAKITDLSDQLLRSQGSYYGYYSPEPIENQTIVGEITSLGLAHRLSTKYTSFVAVEQEVVSTPGATTTVPVPLPLPEGTTYDGFFSRPQVPNPSAAPNASTSPQAGAGGTAFTIENVGGMVGLGTSDLRSTVLNILPWLAILSLPIVSLIVAILYRVMKRNSPERKSFRRVFGRVLEWVFLVCVVGLGILAWFIDEDNAVRPFIRRGVADYLPLLVVPVLMIRGYLRWTTWRRVVVISIVVLSLSALWRAYQTSTLLSVDSGILATAPFVFKAVLFFPMLTAVLYLVLLYGVAKDRVWTLWAGLGVGTLVATSGAIVLARTPFLVGWRWISVALIVGTVLALRAMRNAPKPIPRQTAG